MKVTKRHLLSTPVLLLAVVIFAALGTFLLIHSHADSGSQEYYVSTTGTDTDNNDCSYTNPCASVYHVVGLKALAGGSVINMMAGDYTHQSTLYNGNHSIGASFSSNVTIEPYPGANVIIDGFSLEGYHFTLEDVSSSPGEVLVAGHYLTLDHLNINGGAATCVQIPQTKFPDAAVVAADNCPDGSGGVGVSEQSTNITISNNYIHNNLDRDGIDLGDGGDPQSNITITGNRIEYLRRGPKQGHVDCIQFYGGQSDVTISNNYLSGCSNSNIFMTGSFGDITNVTVNNNLLAPCYSPQNGGVKDQAGCGYYSIYNQTQGFGTCDANGGDPCHNEKDIVYTNNTILGNVDVTKNYITQFKDNILTGSFGYEDCDVTNAFSDSLIGEAPQKQYCHDGLEGSNIVIGSPTFTDYSTQNYNLSSGSLGTGWGASCPTVSITTCPLSAGLLSGDNSVTGIDYKTGSGSDTGGSSTGSQTGGSSTGSQVGGSVTGSQTGGSATGSQVGGSNTGSGTGSGSSTGSSTGGGSVSSSNPPANGTPVNSTPGVSPVKVSGTYKITNRGTQVTSVDGKSPSSVGTSGAVVNNDSINTTKLGNGIHIITAKTSSGVKRVAINVTNPTSLYSIFLSASHHTKLIASYTSLSLASLLLLLIVIRFIKRNTYRIALHGKNIVKGNAVDSKIIEPNQDHEHKDDKN